MTHTELQAVHKKYSEFKTKWELWLAAYEGVDALLDDGHLERNERESQENWKQRIKEAYGFDYSQAVIDLFVFYLFEKEHKERDLGSIGDDALWELFNDDCDLMGMGFDQWLLEQQRYASIFGHVGILVDKPSASFQTRQEQIDGKVYPYVSVYYPTAILDWRWERDELTGRPQLVHLKLKDEDGLYRLWWPDRWEIWRDREEEAESKSGETVAIGEPRLVAEGINSLGEIPFIWLYNIKSRHLGIGVSDIKTVARIDVSIMRNLSHGEEIIKYAAFPMMRAPYEAPMPGDAGPTSKEDRVGVRAVLDFDPTHGEAGKPDWLESKVKEPIDAILEWINRKVQEIYRSVNAGGLHATESSIQAKSGVALRQEFQLLNAKLVAKASALEEAEYGILYFWSKWENREGDYGKIIIKRPRDFSVEDLAADLENALAAKTLITSTVFRKQLMKSLVGLVLPGLMQDKLQEIYDDIEEIEEPKLPEVTAE